MATKFTYEIVENVAALGVEIGRDSKRYDAAYKYAGEKIGGFPGFFSVIISAGEELDRLDVDWGGDADWPITVEKLGTALLDFMIKERRAPHATEMKRLADESLTDL